MFFEFADNSLLDVDLQFMIGDALLVTACMEQGGTSIRGHFPETADTVWRDWYTHEVSSECHLTGPC
jgi:alpha-glucosidase